MKRRQYEYLLRDIDLPEYLTGWKNIQRKEEQKRLREAVAMVSLLIFVVTAIVIVLNLTGKDDPKSISKASAYETLVTDWEPIWSDVNSAVQECFQVNPMMELEIRKVSDTGVARAATEWAVSDCSSLRVDNGIELMLAGDWTGWKLEMMKDNATVTYNNFGVLEPQSLANESSESNNSSVPGV